MKALLLPLAILLPLAACQDDAPSTGTTAPHRATVYCDDNVTTNCVEDKR